MILVTGGAGYIGSHTIVELSKSGHDFLIVDNFINSSECVIDHLEKITNKKIKFINVDLCDFEKLSDLTKDFEITGIIHFAALKAVGESVEQPLLYYNNNINSLLSVLRLCEEREIKNFVFSSSCTVYGSPDQIPVTEKTPTKKAESPYGKSKQFAEEILSDFQKVNEISICNLRYFNPIGAHESGLIGDYPDGKPNNLLPYVTQVAIGIREKLSVFGGDYNTPDGTCLRDYIHVVDLAKAHIKALEYNHQHTNKVSYFNLGTGNGASVFDIIKTFERVNDVKVDFEICPRREGDVEAIYSDCSLSENELGWKTELSLQDMLSSAWKFQKNILK